MELVLNWGNQILLDPDYRGFIQDNFTDFRFYVSISNPNKTSPATYYTEANDGAKVNGILDAAQDLGLGLHGVLCYMRGTGLPLGTDDSPATHCNFKTTKYHVARQDDTGVIDPSKDWRPWLYHGGAQSAITKMFSWAPPMKTIQIPNENPEKGWLAKAHRDNIYPHLVKTRNQRQPKCKILGHPGDEGWDELIDDFCDGVNVHAVNSINGRGAEKVRDAKRRFRGKPVYCQEFAAKNLGDFERELELLKAEDPVSIGSFLGGPQFHMTRSDWNNGNRSAFVLLGSGGVTTCGKAWSKVLAGGGTSPPDPPTEPPIPPPIEPPPPSNGNTVADAKWVRQRVDKHGECMGTNRRLNCLERLDAIIERES